MGRRRIIVASIISATLALGGATSASVAAGTWETFYPAGQLVTFRLPSAWRNTSPPKVARFFALSPAADADVEVLVSPYTASKSSFASDMARSAWQVYLGQDPNAKIRSRHIELPAGHCFEVITSLVRRENSQSFPISIESYSFLHGGKVFEFAYETRTPKAAINNPLFATSARSIRFH